MFAAAVAVSVAPEASCGVSRHERLLALEHTTSRLP